jgi:hypothetical protein
VPAPSGATEVLVLICYIMRSLIICTLHYQIKKHEMGEACSTDREMRNAHNILVGKLEGERQHGRPRRRWEENI